MTDCLAEDDDEENHPVSLTDFIVYPVTRGTERRINCSDPGGLPYSGGYDPFHTIVPGNVRVTGPVVQGRCSFGLIGL